MKMLIAILLLVFTSSAWADAMKVKVKVDRHGDDYYVISYEDRYHQRGNRYDHGRKHHRRHEHKKHRSSHRRHPVFGVYYSPNWWDHHYFGYSGDRHQHQCDDRRHRHHHRYR